MNATLPTEAELARWMDSAEYRRRVARWQRIVKERIAAGKPWTFEEVAKGLRLPLDVVVGGFEYSMAKAGMPVRAVGRVQ